MNGEQRGSSWYEQVAGAANRARLYAENAVGSVNTQKVIARLGEYSTRENLNVSVLQIGANDGRQGDLIQDCIKRYGWRGLLVEPTKSEYESLRNIFSSEINAGRLNVEQCAVAERDGQALLYGPQPSEKTKRLNEEAHDTTENDTELDGFEVPSEVIGLQSLDRQWLAEQIHERTGVPLPDVKVFRIDRVNTYTVSSLKRFLKTSDFFNVISVNAAGLDNVIMQQMHSSQMRPKFYLYNHSNMTIRERRARQKDLRNQGYVGQILNERFTFAELQ